MPTTPPAVFCFRRDLRLDDNSALNDLVRLTASGPTRVLPVFCLDPRQIDPARNTYRSDPAVRFLFESLVDLDAAIRARSPKAGLALFYGPPETLLPELVRLVSQQHDTAPVAVGWNADVTPFSIERDAAIEAAMGKRCPQATVHTNPDDVTVVPLRTIATGAGKPYQKFTPFKKKVRSLGVRAPAPLPDSCQFVDIPSKAALRGTPLAKAQVHVKALFTDSRLACPPTRIAELEGGRAHGLQRLAPAFLRSRCSTYKVDREKPAEDKTTRLSAYIKFGCVSTREVHHAVVAALKRRPVDQEALTSEVVWQAFYAYVALHFPDVLKGQTGRVAGQHNRRNLEMSLRFRGSVDSVWVPPPSSSSTTRTALETWKAGRTGFPLVDAAMRQLAQTGWMHNRSRMVVASFLTKDLRIDWREGEAHFARHLVDYDPASNNGGWQWAASTGADAQPYFRIFSPWRQSEAHDRDAVYIKRYVPELRPVPAKDIHRWNDPVVRAKYATAAKGYPAPMVDHSAASAKTMALMKAR